MNKYQILLWVLKLFFTPSVIQEIGKLVSSVMDMNMTGEQKRTTVKNEFRNIEEELIDNAKKVPNQMLNFIIEATVLSKTKPV